MFYGLLEHELCKYYLLILALMQLYSIHALSNSSLFPCPSSCTCLGTHVDCSSRDLENVPRNLPPWTTIFLQQETVLNIRLLSSAYPNLELQGNLIKEINHSVFMGLNRLVTLDLSDNEIEFVSRSVFAQLPNLETLILKRNLFEAVPLGIEFIPNLQKLDLKLNKIKTLSSVDVMRIAKIEVVDLGRNAIRHYPKTVLISQSDSRIVKLDLNNNAISSFEAETFSQLRTLKVLRLSRNKIEMIDKDAFKGLHDLQSLDLSRNRITNIHALTFASLDSLKNLTFYRNSLSTLDDGSFWGMEQLQRLNLASNRLKAITGGLLYGLTSLTALDLSSNDISWIEPNAWSSSTSLQWLSLASNSLRLVPSMIFQRLVHLHYLSLAHNYIDVLHKDAMNGLLSLNSLDLSGNGLAVCVEDGTVFANTSFLPIHTLRFASNRVRIIPSRAFENFPDLQSLDLSDNPIANIQEGAFEPLRLSHLFINTSSLVCDCDMKWFPTWLQSSGLDRNTILTVCLHPSPLQGIDVTVIDTSNLTCMDNSPRARILDHPIPMMKALLRSVVKLRCRGYGASPLEIAWKVIKNGVSRVLIPDATTEFAFNRSTASNGTANGLTLEYLYSEIMLHDITMNDEAEYQCVVRNHFGSAYSLRSKITVLQLPQIIDAPSNISVFKGESAILRCSARGIPPPVLKWRKDGGGYFPAAVEKRLHIRSNDDVLYILNASHVDVGVYTCRVHNEAGSTESSAHLLVFEKFLSDLKDRRVDSGSVVIFNCSTNDQPVVHVVWYKDGNLIDSSTASSRMSFKADSQILIIYDSRASDSGTYECEFKVGGQVLLVASSKLVVDDSAIDWNKCKTDVDTRLKEHTVYLVVLICVLCSSLVMCFASFAIFISHKKCVASRQSIPPNVNKLSSNGDAVVPLAGKETVVST